MKNSRDLRWAIHRLIREHVEITCQPLEVRRLSLARSSYGADEVIAAIDVLLGGQLTMGHCVAEFERAWSAYLPVAFSVMTNSGSSANLLMLSALAFPGADGHLQLGDEVILPAVAWSTSLFPIVQVGCVPVLVDVDLHTLNIDPKQVEQAITPRTRAIMAVHLLGNPCDMHALVDIARRYGLCILEDCCEAHGANIDGRRVGTFGELSTFSYFFSHHMTAIEGGMVSGSEQNRWHDLLISMRAHGWIRGRSDHDEWVHRYPDIDPRWLFAVPGYNLRPTEINAAFARVQLRKLPDFIEHRVATRKRLLALLKPYEEFFYFQRELPNHLHTSFGWSFVLRPGAPFARIDFQTYLESCSIQTRPILAGNLARQPALQHISYRVVGELANADLIHAQGVMVGNHHNVTEAQENHLVECVDTFVRRYSVP